MANKLVVAIHNKQNNNKEIIENEKQQQTNKKILTVKWKKLNFWLNKKLIN